MVAHVESSLDLPPSWCLLDLSGSLKAMSSGESHYKAVQKVHPEDPSTYSTHILSTVLTYIITILDTGTRGLGP